MPLLFLNAILNNLAQDSSFSAHSLLCQSRLHQIQNHLHHLPLACQTSPSEKRKMRTLRPLSEQEEQIILLLSKRQVTHSTLLHTAHSRSSSYQLRVCRSSATRIMSRIPKRGLGVASRKRSSTPRESGA